MNNKIIAAAIVALAGAFAFNASAQQADNTAATCNNNKQCTLGKRAAGPTAFNPFEGINLSKDQESKLCACSARPTARLQENKTRPNAARLATTSVEKCSKTSRLFSAPNNTYNFWKITL